MAIWSKSVRPVRRSCHLGMICSQLSGCALQSAFMDWSLDEALNRMVEAVLVLTEDVRSAAHLSEHRDTPFSRRAYVRAVLAQVEGTLNLLGNFVLEAQAAAVVHLSAEDVELLAGEKTITNAEKSRIVFLPIFERVAPVFDLYSRVYGKPFRVDKSGQGWIKLQRSIDLRNRITHPKTAASFYVSDAELDDLEAARKWFAGNLRSIVENFEVSE